MRFRVIAVAVFAVALATLSVPASAKSPAIIAAFSQTNLASDGYYRQLGRALAEAPGEPFDVRLLVRGELGPDEVHFAALRRGRIQIAGVGYASISTALPEFTLLNAPFLFDRWDEVDFVYDNFLIPFLNELLEAGGLHGIRHFGMVWHGIYGQTPILEPENVRGLRYRALIDRASQFIAVELKSDAVQIPTTDLVTALQTGLITGGETNELIYTMTGITEQAPHWTYTRHTTSMLAVITTKAWWNSLTPELQRIIDTGFPDAATARAGIRADSVREMNQAVGDGVIAHELSPDARARWVAATLPVHRQLIDAAGGRSQELYDLVMAGKRTFKMRIADE